MRSAKKMGSFSESLNKSDNEQKVQLKLNRLAACTFSRASLNWCILGYCRINNAVKDFTSLKLAHCLQRLWEFVRDSPQHRKCECISFVSDLCLGRRFPCYRRLVVRFSIEEANHLDVFRWTTSPVDACSCSLDVSVIFSPNVVNAGNETLYCNVGSLRN